MAPSISGERLVTEKPMKGEKKKKEKKCDSRSLAVTSDPRMSRRTRQDRAFRGGGGGWALGRVVGRVSGGQHPSSAPPPGDGQRGSSP